MLITMVILMIGEVVGINVAHLKYGNCKCSVIYCFTIVTRILNIIGMWNVCLSYLCVLWC